ncbi:MAG: RHS repeat-associated core domain-containing protein [Verrucomicrobiae bacterium]|nr:RHS repeat-associated core domain-containing protein [Verrucomicrobiae bacterium]
MTSQSISWTQAYDANTGRISQIKADFPEPPPPATTTDRDFTYAYLSDSNHVSSVTSPSAYQQYREYNDRRELYKRTLNRWNSSVRADYSTPTYDLQGQYLTYQLIHNGTSTLASKLESGSTITYTMTYDDQQQLKTWNSSRTSGTDSDYDWDSAGNITSYDGLTGIPDDPYPDKSYTATALNKIQPTTGTAFSYDFDGNLTGDGTWTINYDTRNRIESMSSTSKSKSLRFSYDYLGRRVEKKAYNNATESGTPATWKRFIYDGWQLVAEIDVTNSGSTKTLSKTFFWGLDKSDSVGGAGGAMGLLMFRDHVPTTDVDYFPVYDLNGNVTGIMNQSGTLVAWYEYDAFGKIIKQGGTSGADTLNTFGFSTQYTDRETGLVYYGLRYYDPAKARFVNRDPIGEAGGLNLYRFVGNNPVSRIDVLGLKSKCGSKPRMDTQNYASYLSDLARWEACKEDEIEIKDIDPFEVVEEEPNVPLIPVGFGNKNIALFAQTGTGGSGNSLTGGGASTGGTQKENGCGSGTLAGAGPGTMRNVLSAQAAPQPNAQGPQIGLDVLNPGSTELKGTRGEASWNWTLTGLQGTFDAYIVQHVVSQYYYLEDDGSRTPLTRRGNRDEKWEAWPVTVTNGQASFPEGRNDTFGNTFYGSDIPSRGQRPTVREYTGTGMLIVGQNQGISQWARDRVTSGGLRTTRNRADVQWWNPAGGDTASHTMTHTVREFSGTCTSTTNP